VLGTLNLRELASGRTLRVLTHAKLVTALTFSADGGTIVAGGAGGSLELARLDQLRVREPAWAVDATRAEYVAGPAYGAGAAMAFDREGTPACGMVPFLESQKEFAIKAGRMTRLGSSDDGSVICAVGVSGELRVFDGRTGERTRVVNLADPALGFPYQPGTRASAVLPLRKRGGVLIALRDTHGGAIVAQIGEDGSARTVYSAPATGDAVLAGGEGPVAAAVGMHLALWRSMDGPAHEITLGHGGSALAFDRGSKRLAIGCFDGAVLVLDDLESITPRQLEGSARAPVRSAVFTPDGSRLLTGSEDGTLIVWDVPSGEALASLNMEAPVLHLCFPEGKDRGLAVMRNGLVRWLGVRTDERTVSGAGEATPAPK